MARHALRGSLVQLRPITESDRDVIIQMASDPMVTRYLSWGPLERDRADAAFETLMRRNRRRPRRHYELAVRRLSDGAVVGAASLTLNAPQQAEIGYSLARPYWRQGYGLDAARLLCRLGFEQLGLHRIVATTHPDNEASAGLLLKLGMTREGRLREATLARGQWRDTILFSILAQDWDRLRHVRPANE